MKEIDFMSTLHKSTSRDYLARVNDPDFPKAQAANLAKKFDYDYWDGDRRICYGGYNYIPGRWEKVAKNMQSEYNLNSNAKILDIGCGKGYLLYDFLKILIDFWFLLSVFLFVSFLITFAVSEPEILITATPDTPGPDDKA